MENLKKVLALILLIIIVVCGIIFYSRHASEGENTAISGIQNYKTFNSSGLKYQFDFYEFKYPADWDAYPQDSDKIDLIATKDVPADTSKINFYSINKPTIEVHLTSAPYTEDAIRKYFNPEKLTTKKLGDKDVIVFSTSRGINDAKGNLLAYFFSTPYVNKQSVLFALSTGDVAATPQQAQILENMTASFKVIETEKGTQMRESQKQRVLPLVQ